MSQTYLRNRIQFPIKIEFTAPDANGKGFYVFAHNEKEYREIMSLVFKTGTPRSIELIKEL